METLRWARLGDDILLFRNFSGLWPSEADLVFQGTPVDREGQLYIQLEETFISVTKAAWLGDAYGVVRWYSSERIYLGTLYAEQKYYHLKFDPGKLDWVGAGLDVGGLIADAVSLGTVGKLPDVAKIARTVGKVVDLSAVAWSWPLFAIDVVTGRRSGDEALGFGLDVADLLSPVPCVFDLAGLSVNLGRGVYRTP